MPCAKLAFVVVTLRGQQLSFSHIACCKLIATPRKLSDLKTCIVGFKMQVQQLRLVAYWPSYSLISKFSVGRVFSRTAYKRVRVTQRNGSDLEDHSTRLRSRGQMSCFDVYRL